MMINLTIVQQQQELRLYSNMNNFKLEFNSKMKFLDNFTNNYLNLKVYSKYSKYKRRIKRRYTHILLIL